MEQEEKQLVEMCLSFAKKADALEKRAFDNGEYRLKGFVPNFNMLFNTYASGKENRTISGLDFRDPPRYANINSSKKTVIEKLSERSYHITFEGNPKWRSIRFKINKQQDEWKLLYFETYLGLSNRGENEGEEIWRKHKL